MKGTSLASLLALLGCAGSPLPAPDASSLDGASAPGAPSPPMFTPCPAGWREVRDVPSSVTCDPWPTTGYDAHCADGFVHWPGTPGCARIGTACAPDGWPSDLPSDRTIVFVNGNAAPGGDGTSRARAFAHIRDAAILAPSGAVIAVATGRYDETIALSDGQTLWGACVSGTVLTVTLDAPSGLVQLGSRTGVRNLSLASPATAGLVAMSAVGVDIVDVVVTGARAFGIYASGSSVSARNVVVRGTVAQGDGRFGRGLQIEPNTQVTLARVLLDGNRDDGVVVAGPMTTLAASDLVVRGTLAATTGLSGRGLDISPGARVTLAGVVLEGNREGGIFASGGGTTIDASDLVVRGTLARESDGLRGRGISVQTGVRMTLARAWIEANREYGISAQSAGTVVTATDLVVRGTLEQLGDHRFGRGVDLENGARLTIARGAFDANRECGLFANGEGTSLDATDLLVRNTLSEATDLAYGVALWAQFGAVVHVASGAFESSRMAGVVAAHLATVSLSNVAVRGVAASACPSDVCVGTSGGFGLAAIFGGSLTALRFVVDDATACGVMVGANTSTRPTALDLTAGVVRGAPVGACIQVDGYDTSRVDHDVQYRDVGVPLQATGYGLPMSLASGM